MQKFLNTGWFVLGENVRAFEAEYAQYLSSSSFVGVASGLDALTLSFVSAGLPRGGEVLVPSNTYIASILSIMHAGLRPVLVEPDKETYNLCPKNCESMVTEKTVGLLPVHLYGKPCDMESLTNFAKKYRLVTVEDCAQAHGAKYKGQHVGTFGDFGAFSFFPTKNLGALGDAGGVAVRADTHLETLKSLRFYGFRHQKYVSEDVGFNSRLDELQAAFLREKLKRLDELVDHKRLLAKYYLENIKDDFVLPVVQEGYDDAYHIFNIRHEQRDKVREHLMKHEIQTLVHYPVAPHQQKALSEYFKGQTFPVAEEIHRTTLSLPISGIHTLKDMERVCKALNHF